MLFPLACPMRLPPVVDILQLIGTPHTKLKFSLQDRIKTLTTVNYNIGLKAT